MPAATMTAFTYDRGRDSDRPYKKNITEDQGQFSLSTEMTKSDTRLSETVGNGSGAGPWSHHTDKTDAKTAAEQAVCEMGIPEHLVKLAGQIHLLETGEHFNNVQQLYLASYDIASSPEKQTMLARKLHLAEVSGRSSQQLKGEVEEDGAEMRQSVENVEMMHQDESNDPETATAKAECSQTEASTTIATKKTELRNKVLDLIQENQKLNRRKKCRVCKKIDLSSSGVTFLPCGHFITCEECAEKSDDCPACGKSIMGTVRTFLS